MKKNEFLSLLFIFFISLISVFDFFINTGRPATFDAPTHMTDIAGYTQALLDKNFPVFWLDKFGNYGMPIGLFSHQFLLTSAGLVNILLQNPPFTFYFFFLTGIFLTNASFYFFLRIYFSRFPSIVGITLLTFSAYRITNIYIRGDLPETFSGIFLGTILLGMYYFFQKNKIWGFFLISLSYFLLTITHPLMLITYSFFVFPYLFFLLLQIPNIKKLVVFFLALILGVGMASYFILPIIIETKYLYFGQVKNHLSPQFLSWKNFFGENWFYFYNSDIFPRGQFIQTGLIELLTLAVSILFTGIAFFKKNKKEILHVRSVAVLSAVVVLFMTTTYASFLYEHVPFLSSLQFPWRILSLFIFLPPIIVASLLQKIQRKTLLVVACIFLIILVRFPQLYGKNYTNLALTTYYFTPYNLFPIDYNTIWTGKTEDYPIEKQKIGILQGSGKILSENVHNSERAYTISAQTPLRLVDYTFYFPGWNVYVDGKKTTIEFQDPRYRGVITYMIPVGQHTVHVVLEDTIIRKLGKLFSIIFAGIFIIVFFLRKQVNKLL